ncbi:hypothetical protein D3C76_1373320 [compost metagenome]
MTIAARKDLEDGIALKVGVVERRLDSEFSATGRARRPVKFTCKDPLSQLRGAGDIDAFGQLSCDGIAAYTFDRAGMENGHAVLS